MKIVFLGARFVSVYAVLLFSFFSFTSSYFLSDDFVSRDDPTITYKYDRIDEVVKQCKFVLSSASEFKPDNNRVYSIKKELSLVNGDWEQEVGGAPLMPFDDPDAMRNDSISRSPLNLVSFWVKDVDQDHISKNYISINGILYLAKTIDGNLVQNPGGNPQFQMWSRHSELLISFQGIYIENENNEGERVMCLLGNAMLPSRKPDSPDPWEWLKDSGVNYNQPPLLQDDQIMLVLRYPKKIKLTNMIVLGEMKSLNQKSNLKYFDKIHVSSLLDSSATYEFGSENIVSKACDPYPYEDSLMNNELDIYKGSDFCTILKQYSQGGPFTIVPNWRCNGTSEYCSKPGPFILNKEINATNGGFKDVKLIMQRVKCQQNTLKDGVISAKVFAVFRIVPPSKNFYFEGLRSGVNNMTLAAEGVWRASSGQLCMVGCIGNVCDSRICLYLPLSFSIQQRSVIIGSFSSINEHSKSYFPLSFEKLVQPNELWDRFQTFHLSYKYSKIVLAGIVLEKDEPFHFGSVIKKSLLTFPKLEDSEAYMSSLSLLSEDLTLHVSAVLDPFPSSQLIRTEVQMEIISVGPLFGRYWSYQNGSTSSKDEEIPYHTRSEYTEKMILLNVSAQLSISGSMYSNFSVLFLEGIYDPHVGKLYAVGCRDVRASWVILSESMDLEAGLDCLIEVVVSYPPTTSRWLVNPTARISINSQRNEDDPLHFNSIKLQTRPIIYRRQREDILSRRGVEGILRILTLSLSIFCISSQLFYIRDSTDSVPYISIVMLGVQAIGYSLPLVTGAEAMFKKIASESYANSSYDLENNQWFHVIDYTVKLLVLTSFLLTLRICQKVWKSRIRLLTRTPLEPLRVPSDVRVFTFSFIFHGMGYTIVLILHMNNILRPLGRNTFMDSTGNSHAVWEWAKQLEEYIGLVQDFFLFPQIIGNLLWQIHCKPLRKIYYIGITMVRLLPHVYDYIRDPIPNPYFSEDYEFVNPNLDFFSKFGDIAIPVTAVFLMVIVYIQQRWNYEKLSQTLAVGQLRLLPSGSKMYQRLPSVGFEAELVSGVNEDTGPDKEHDDKE